jgi:quinol monooxygenase YgiN
MFGTVARLRVKPGKEADLNKIMREWDEDMKPQTKGAIATYIYQLDQAPNQWVMAVVFEDRESYVKNANDPKTDAWYRKMRELLEEDPDWEDGEIVYHS